MRDSDVETLSPIVPRTILVVEDNEISKLCMVSLLEQAGFRVVQARGAEEALLSLECRTDIVLVVSNVVMRGRMDGLELAHTVNARWPSVEIIIVSGKRGLSESDLPKKCCLFAKPYHENELMFEIGALVGL